jgi:hypothetical protein
LLVKIIVESAQELGSCDSEKRPVSSQLTPGNVCKPAKVRVAIINVHSCVPEYANGLFCAIGDSMITWSQHYNRNPLGIPLKDHLTQHFASKKNAWALERMIPSILDVVTQHSKTTDLMQATNSHASQY